MILSLLLVAALLQPERPSAVRVRKMAQPPARPVRVDTVRVPVTTFVPGLIRADTVQVSQTRWRFLPIPALLAIFRTRTRETSAIGSASSADLPGTTSVTVTVGGATGLSTFVTVIGGSSAATAGASAAAGAWAGSGSGAIAVAWTPGRHGWVPGTVPHTPPGSGPPGWVPGPQTEPGQPATPPRTPDSPSTTVPEPLPVALVGGGLLLLMLAKRTR